MSNTDSKPLSGKVALVTGANSGIGLETARALAADGATVVMCARSLDKGQQAVSDLKAATGSESIELLQLDLASLESVRAAAATFLEGHERLDLLINNAGLILSQRSTTVEGFEESFGVNHLGHFLLTKLLLPTIQASAPARIVNVSSEAHKLAKGGLDFDDLNFESRPYSAFGAYGASKLANIYFTRQLAKRLEGTGVVTHTLHPGTIRSGFGKDGDATGIYRAVVWLFGPFLRGPKAGARTSLHCATSEDAGTSSGEYWKGRRRRKPSALALDDAAAERLWAISEELVAPR